MENFTPIQSLIGGLLIGASASILILFIGKIAGISGITASLMQFKNTFQSQHRWRLLFMTGLLISSKVYEWFEPLPATEISASTGTLIIAGLLVGFGTKMGSGCTSGHGVCGLSRLSLRSLVATVCFMFTGFIVSYLMLHVV